MTRLKFRFRFEIENDGRPSTMEGSSRCAGLYFCVGAAIAAVMHRHRLAQHMSMPAT
jgi:hypothetical protein